MANSLELVLQRIEHFQFIDTPFTIYAQLVDSLNNVPRLGENLQLKVLIHLEEKDGEKPSTYTEHYPNLIEVMQNDGIRGDTGRAEITVMIKDVSMHFDNKRFIISLQGYQPGIGANLITAKLNPITCIRHKLIIYEEPNAKNKLLINDDGQGGYMWYKDEGAKDKCIEMVVQLVDSKNVPVLNRAVPLQVSLTYGNGQMVQPDGVLIMMPDRGHGVVLPSGISPVTGTEIIRFRVNEVSRNHRKQNFQIVVSPDKYRSPDAGDVSPAVSVSFEVKSKRTAENRARSTTATVTATHTGFASSNSSGGALSDYVGALAPSGGEEVEEGGPDQATLLLVKREASTAATAMPIGGSSNNGEGSSCSAAKRYRTDGPLPGGETSLYSHSLSAAPSAATGIIFATQGASYQHTYSTAPNEVNASPRAGSITVISNSSINTNGGSYQKYYSGPLSSNNIGADSVSATGGWGTSLHDHRQAQSPAVSLDPVWSDRAHGDAADATTNIIRWVAASLKLIDLLIGDQNGPPAVRTMAADLRTTYNEQTKFGLKRLQDYTHYQLDYHVRKEQMMLALQKDHPLQQYQVAAAAKSNSSPAVTKSQASAPYSRLSYAMLSLHQQQQPLQHAHSSSFASAQQYQPQLMQRSRSGNNLGDCGAGDEYHSHSSLEMGGYPPSHSPRMPADETARFISRSGGLTPGQRSTDQSPNSNGLYTDLNGAPDAQVQAVLVKTVKVTNKENMTVTLGIAAFGGPVQSESGRLRPLVGFYSFAEQPGGEHGIYFRPASDVAALSESQRNLVCQNFEDACSSGSPAVYEISAFRGDLSLLKERALQAWAAILDGERVATARTQLEGNGTMMDNVSGVSGNGESDDLVAASIMSSLAGAK